MSNVALLFLWQGS